MTHTDVSSQNDAASMFLLLRFEIFSFISYYLKHRINHRCEIDPNKANVAIKTHKQLTLENVINLLRKLRQNNQVYFLFVSSNPISTSKSGCNSAISGLRQDLNLKKKSGEIGLSGLS